MRLMQSSILRRYLGLIIVILALVRPALPSDNTENELTEVRDFFQLLRVIASAPDSSRLNSLENWVQNHAGNHISALWLVEQYHLSNTLNRGHKFFSSLPVQAKDLQIKHWMLAKIYHLKNDVEAASASYKRALSSAHIYPELLVDISVLESRNRGRLPNDWNPVDQSSNSELRGLLKALRPYVKRQWTEAIRYFEELPDKYHRDWTILYSWGYCLRQIHSDKIATEKFLKALNIAKAEHNLHFQAKTYIILGNAATSLDFQRTYYDSSYAIAKDIGILNLLPYIAGNRGLLEGEAGELDLADSLLTEAIEFSEQLQSPRLMSTWSRRHGNLLSIQGRYDEAFKLYDLASDFADEAQSNFHSIIATIREGGLYRILRRGSLARQILSGALNSASRLNDPFLMTQADIQIAHLEFSIGNYQAARDIYKRYLKRPPTNANEISEHAWWRINCGRSYLAQANFDEAAKQFKIAYDLTETDGHLYRSMALLKLAEIDLANGNIDSGRRHLDECDQLTAKVDSEDIIVNIYTLRGDASAKSRQIKQAITYYRKAADILETMRERLTGETSRIQFFRDKTNIYSKLAGSYNKLHQTTQNRAYLDSLYAYLELNQSRALRELRSIESTAITQEEAYQRQKYDEARKRHSVLQRNLRENGKALLPEARDSLDIQLRVSQHSVIAQKLRLQQSHSLDSKTLLAEMPKLSEIQEAISDSSALIYYHFSEQALALVVTRNDIAAVPLQSNEEEITNLIARLLNPFYRDPDDVIPFRAEIAYTLYEKLIKPLEEQVDLPGKLLIVPDATTANLQFDILLTATTQKAEYHQLEAGDYANKFLIHRYDIGYLPNAGFLTDQSINRKNSIGIFAYGGQGGTKRRWSSPIAGQPEPLYHANQEAQDIQELHPNSRIYHRKIATVDAFTEASRKFDILHFATHAFADSSNDIFSGLVFNSGSDSTDDGYLMGYELNNLRITADMVTLNACETGRGKVVAGEGLLGLPRLFLGAGANTVMMTRWVVEDRIASKLMVKFYDHYLNNGYSKTRALTAAKRAAIRGEFDGSGQYQHPLYWAPFSIYGSPGIEETYSWWQYLLVFLFGVSLLWLALRRIRHDSRERKIAV